MARIDHIKQSILGIFGVVAYYKSQYLEEVRKKRKVHSFILMILFASCSVLFSVVLISNRVLDFGPVISRETIA